MNMETKLVRAALALVDAQHAFMAASSGVRDSSENFAALRNAIAECALLETEALGYREFYVSSRVDRLPRLRRALSSVCRAAGIDANRYAEAKALLESLE